MMEIAFYVLAVLFLLSLAVLWRLAVGDRDFWCARCGVLEKEWYSLRVDRNKEIDRRLVAQSVAYETERDKQSIVLELEDKIRAGEEKMKWIKERVDAIAEIADSLAVFSLFAAADDEEDAEEDADCSPF
jgi:hypothetical protein